MRLTVLLGSGSSRPAGIPSTKEITEKVCSGEGIVRHTDGVYYHLSQNPRPDNRRKLVLALTNVLFSEVQAYYDGARSCCVNYENCCYAASQLRDAVSGEFDNPVVEPMIEKLAKKAELSDLLGRDEDRLLLFTETVNYIQDVVWGMLSRTPGDLRYLDWVINVTRDMELSSVDLVTLNHDTVLERAFRSNSVGFCDGFGGPVNGVRFWEPDRLQDSDRIRLVKLHGSIDWFLFLPNKKISIPENRDPYYTAPRPVLLVGTFNKMLEYTTGVFADLHCHFHRCLRRTDLLISCGYGFGDKGINTKLSEWINEDDRRRLVLLHGDPVNTLERSRGAIAKHWRSWQDREKLRFLEKWVHEISWEEVKSALLD